VHTTKTVIFYYGVEPARLLFGALQAFLARGLGGSWGLGWAGWGEEAQKGTKSCPPPEWAMGALRSLNTECAPHQGGYLLLGGGACPAFVWGATGLFDSGE
jgi:hypothetical protein